MNDKITVERLGLYLNKLIDVIQAGAKVPIIPEIDLPMLKAIRKHLLESDIAHWMDRCHELEAELAELTKKLSEVKFDVQNPNRLDMGKPGVSRVFLDYQKYPLYKDEVIKLLVEYGIEVSDG